MPTLLENYAQITERKDEKTNRVKKEQVFPRYHQLDVVRKLLDAVPEDGVGKRYLIQHSAGIGKSNSISWLAHQLIGLEKEGSSLFDTVIVVTDRRVLDKQLRDNIKRFAQVSSIVGAVTEGSGQLRTFLEQGKKVVITDSPEVSLCTWMKLETVIVTGSLQLLLMKPIPARAAGPASKMNMVLTDQSGPIYDTLESPEDIEDAINEIITSRRMLTNASYFAFTATPKNKTLEIFGEPYLEGDAVKHRPFHSYTMKQAIQEGFILDVLQNYTPVYSYYKLIKSIESDPEFDVKKAKKKLRWYVESNEYAIRQKAEIMVDHFIEQVIGRHKIGGLGKVHGCL